MALNPLATGDYITRTQPASWFRRNITWTNVLKYGSVAVGGIALGSTALSVLRPTYQTGPGGNVYTQTAPSSDPLGIGSIMNSIMPLLMMTMMLPLMRNMFESNSSKESD